MEETSGRTKESKSSDIKPIEEERRSYERVSPPTTEEVEGNEFNISLQNISISGFAFLTNNGLFSGKNLNVSLGKSKQVQAKVLSQRNVVFDPVFVSNHYSVHCQFITPILESDITNLFDDLTNLNITIQ